MRVELTMTVDVESIVEISAKELSTGKETTVQLNPSGGLSPEEMSKLIARRRDA